MNRFWPALAILCFASGCGTSENAGGGGGSLDAAFASDGNPCAWSGTWAGAATYLTGDCGAEPAFPELHISDDGGLGVVADGSVVPCAVSNPYQSPVACQVNGLCQPWLISTNFHDCPTEFPCSGVATDVEGAGQCGLTLTFTRVGE